MRPRKAYLHWFGKKPDRAELQRFKSYAASLGFWQSGRDMVRSLVRFRDHDTCQKCQRVWNPKSDERRFFVTFKSGKQTQRKYISVKKIHNLWTLCYSCSKGGTGTPIYKRKEAVYAKDKEKKIANLTPDQRRLIRDLFSTGLTTGKIAEETGIKLAKINALITL